LLEGMPLTEAFTRLLQGRKSAPRMPSQPPRHVRTRIKVKEGWEIGHLPAPEQQPLCPHKLHALDNSARLSDGISAGRSFAPRKCVNWENRLLAAGQGEAESPRDAQPGHDLADRPEDRPPAHRRTRPARTAGHATHWQAWRRRHQARPLVPPAHTARPRHRNCPGQLANGGCPNRRERSRLAPDGCKENPFPGIVRILCPCRERGLFFASQ
jgi:hypothetical protein